MGSEPLAPYPRATKPKGFLIGLIVALALGGLATAGAVRSIYADRSQNREFNEERVVADLASCARGNVFRANLREIELGKIEFQRTDIDSILHYFGAPDDRIADLEEIRKPRRDEIIAQIMDLTAPVDCLSVTPGADTLNPDLIPEGAIP